MFPPAPTHTCTYTHVCTHTPYTHHMLLSGLGCLTPAHKALKVPLPPSPWAPPMKHHLPVSHPDHCDTKDTPSGVWDQGPALIHSPCVPRLVLWAPRAHTSPKGHLNTTHSCGPSSLHQELKEAGESTEAILSSCLFFSSSSKNP